MSVKVQKLSAIMGFSSEAMSGVEGMNHGGSHAFFSTNTRCKAENIAIGRDKADLEMLVLGIDSQVGNLLGYSAGRSALLLL